MHWPQSERAHLKLYAPYHCFSKMAECDSKRQNVTDGESKPPPKLKSDERKADQKFRPSLVRIMKVSLPCVIKEGASLRVPRCLQNEFCAQT